MVFFIFNSAPTPKSWNEYKVTNVCFVYLSPLDLLPTVRQIWKINLFQSFILLLNHLGSPFLKAGWRKEAPFSSNSRYFVQETFIFRYNCSSYLHLSFLVSAVHLEDVPWSQLYLLNKMKEEFTSVAPWSTLNMKFPRYESYGGLVRCFIPTKQGYFPTPLAILDSFCFQKKEKFCKA